MATATLTCAAPEYTLTLSEEEARTLLFVCRQVGGPREGRRAHIDSINTALSATGLRVPRSYDDPGDFELSARENCVYFNR